MLKKLVFVIASLYAAAAFAAVDVNRATAAELDGVKGIGPGLSGKILQERQNGDFKDWSDFIGRVGGVGDKTAARLSADGLTVQGKKFSAAAAAKAQAKAKAQALKNQKAAGGTRTAAPGTVESPTTTSQAPVTSAPTPGAVAPTPSPSPTSTTNN